MKTDAIEKFIRKPYLVHDMVKDSELVKEVENFLEKHNLDISEMIYNRSWEFNEKPTFDIITNNLKSLEKLAQKTKSTVEDNYDKMSFHKLLVIKNDRYDLYLYKPMKD